MLPTHPKVAQPKPWAFRPQVCYGALNIRHGCQTTRWTISEITHNRVNIFMMNGACPLLFTIRVYNKTELICLHTVKWFQVLLCNTNNLTSLICWHTVKWLNSSVCLIQCNEIFFPVLYGGVMAKVLECGLEISEFQLQSCYYVHFRTNILEKAMDPLFTCYGLNRKKLNRLLY